jgi:hypothetical protein
MIILLRKVSKTIYSWIIIFPGTFKHQSHQSIYPRSEHHGGGLRDRKLCDRNKCTIEGSNCRIINALVLLPNTPAVTATPPFTALLNDPRGTIANAAINPMAAE